MGVMSKKFFKDKANKSYRLLIMMWMQQDVEDCWLWFGREDKSNWSSQNRIIVDKAYLNVKRVYGSQSL